MSDIRTAAEREAERRWPDSFVGQIAAKHDFVAGAVWAAARVTPTGEQIAQRLASAREPEYQGIEVEDFNDADAVLALIQELAKD